MQGPWITTPDAATALEWAAVAPDRDPLRLGRELERRFGLDAPQRAALLTQVELRERAARRWGSAVGELLFSRDGLEQATRPVLAAWRAERLRALGVRTIADLGCGLGMEARAFAAEGMQVRAVERDPEAGVLAAANLRGLDATVFIGDLTDPAVLASAIDGADAVFLDPARRDPNAPRAIDGRSGHRVSDPEQWSPPWSWICELGTRVPQIVVKVAPGIDHALIPTGTSATWAAVDGDLVEASIWWFHALPDRSALALVDGNAHLLDSTMPTRDDVASIGNFLIDCASVVTRSGLVTTLAARIDAARIDPHIGYLTCDAEPPRSPFHTSYRVLDAMPFDRRAVAKTLAALGCGALTVTKRGFSADTEQLRTQWLRKCDGTRDLVVALTRIGDAPTAIIGER